MAQTNLHCEILTWGTICKQTEKLAQAIRKDGFKPDIMIAIARGGWVPARLLCDYIDFSHLASIRIEHYTAGANRHRDARLSIPLNIDISNQNVLLIDDVSDSGDTLDLAKKHLNEFTPHTIRSAVLHHKTVSTFKPDYYAQKIIKWRWLIYPWAVHEDIAGFLDRMKPKPRTITEAEARLASEFNIRLSRKIITGIMNTK